MRRYLSFALVAAAAGCASSPSSSGPNTAPGPSERTLAVDDQNIYRTTVLPNAKSPVPATADRAFQALRLVYDELGVKPTMVDPNTGRIGNTNFWVSRRLAGNAISTYLNCGDTFSGPIANTYRIYISLASIIRPDGPTASELETAFSAEAQNMEGTSSDRVACGSTGRLEEQIRKSLLLKVATAK